MIPSWISEKPRSVIRPLPATDMFDLRTYITKPARVSSARMRQRTFVACGIESRDEFLHFLDDDLERHARAHGLRDDAVLLGQRERLLHLRALRLEEGGRHPRIDPRRLETETAGRILADVRRGAHRGVRVDDLQLLQEDGPGVQEARG